jgi:predicted exporter
VRQPRPSTKARLRGEVSADLVGCLSVAVSGRRRYLLQVQPPLAAEAWNVRVQRVCGLSLLLAH